MPTKPCRICYTPVEVKDGTRASTVRCTKHAKPKQAPPAAKKTASRKPKSE